MQNKLRKVEIDLADDGTVVDVVFFFADGDTSMPWGSVEFEEGSETRARLELIEAEIAIVFEDVGNVEG